MASATAHAGPRYCFSGGRFLLLALPVRREGLLQDFRELCGGPMLAGRAEAVARWQRRTSENAVRFFFLTLQSRDAAPRDVKR